MRGQEGVLVICLVVVGIQCRVIDQELYKNFWDLPSVFYDNLQKISLDDEPYYTEEVPMALREVREWPAKETKHVIGQVGGLAADSVGNVVVFHRANRRWDARSFNRDNTFNSELGAIPDDVILTLAADTGKILASFGAGEYYMPHGLTVDADDNLWLTDVARHQVDHVAMVTLNGLTLKCKNKNQLKVMKIPKGSESPSLVLGIKMEPGDDEKHFCKPTDVAVAANGDFFVADGYCNSRILKFSPNGTLLGQWGKQPASLTSLEEDEFSVAHSLALDEARDMICVADRENNRIQCFDAGLNGTTAGTFRDSFQPGEGPIFAIEYDPNADVLYAVNGAGTGSIVEGFTLDMDGNLLETWDPDLQPFDLPHDITVSRDGESVYVGDIGQSTGVYKLMRDMDGAFGVGK